MTNDDDIDPQHCAFCGLPAYPGKKLIKGQISSLCEDCIIFCHNFLEGSHRRSFGDFSRQIIDPPKPMDIKSYLDMFVIGQDHAKKVLSVGAYNHYKRVIYNTRRASMKKIDLEAFNHDTVLEKANILLIGPTGSGKTLLARTLAEFLNVPFAIADATSLTEAGYVGEDVENMLLKLYQAADENVEIAEHGIIFIDEMDKVSRKSKNQSITRDVSGEGVQQALLKIIEGTVSSVPPQGGRKHPHQKMIQMDTTNILFICGGAFVGLEDIISSRVKEQSVGFGATESKLLSNNNDTVFDSMLSKLHPEDLMYFGFVPELVGRLPVIATLNGHSKESLRRVLIEPKNSVARQAQKFFELNNVELVFDNDALDAIASKAFDQNVGARGLRTIVEDMLLHSMYTIPSQSNIKKIRITKEVVLSHSEPITESTSVTSDSSSVSAIEDSA